MDQHKETLQILKRVVRSLPSLRAAGADTTTTATSRILVDEVSNSPVPFSEDRDDRSMWQVLRDVLQAVDVYYSQEATWDKDISSSGSVVATDSRAGMTSGANDQQHVIRLARVTATMFSVLTWGVRLQILFRNGHDLSSDRPDFLDVTHGELEAITKEESREARALRMADIVTETINRAGGASCLVSPLFIDGVGLATEVHARILRDSSWLDDKGRARTVALLKNDFEYLTVLRTKYGLMDLLHGDLFNVVPAVLQQYDVTSAKH